MVWSSMNDITITNLSSLTVTGMYLSKRSIQRRVQDLLLLHFELGTFMKTAYITAASWSAFFSTYKQTLNANYRHMYFSESLRDVSSS